MRYQQWIIHILPLQHPCIKWNNYHIYGIVVKGWTWNLLQTLPNPLPLEPSLMGMPTLCFLLSPKGSILDISQTNNVLLKWIEFAAVDRCARDTISYHTFSPLSDLYFLQSVIIVPLMYLWFNMDGCIPPFLIRTWSTINLQLFAQVLWRSKRKLSVMMIVSSLIYNFGLNVD